MGSLVFPEFKQADFIGAMEAAERSRLRRFEMQQAQAKLLSNQQEAERQRQIQLLQGAALQGDPTAMYRLQGVAPEQAIQLEKFGAEQQLNQQKQQAAGVEAQTNQLKMEDLRRQEMLRRFDQQISLFEKAQANPQTLPVVMRIMAAQGLAPAEAAQYRLDPADIPEVINGLRTQKQMFESNEGSQRLREFQAFLEQREREFGPMTAAQHKQAWDEFRQKMYAPGSGMQINIGDNQKATSAMTTDLQKEINQNLQTLSMLKRLDATFDESYVNGFSQLKNEFLGFLNKWTGISIDADKRRAARQWVSERSQFFDQYRKLITGAGAAQAELVSLMNSILSPETPPDEVKASIQQLVEKTERNTKIAIDILANGVPTSREEFDRRLDAAILAADASQKESAKNAAIVEKRQQINAYGKQLMDGGMSKEQAIQEARRKFGL